ncbi:MAG: TVP38/TMEM64 family protein [Desulfovibrionaceae bacterium]
MDNKPARALIKGFILLATLAGIMFGLKHLGVEDAFNTAWVDTYLRDKGLAGQLLFIAFATGFTAVGLPRQIVSFLAGYAYGFLHGTLFATVGTALGCALSFYYARLLGQEFITRRHGRRIARVNAILRQSPFAMTLVIRFLPVGSNLLTNLVAGVSTVPALWFLLGSGLGFIPQTAIFALLGSGVRVDPVWRTGLSVALFILSSLIGYLLYRRHRAAQAVSGD